MTTITRERLEWLSKISGRDDMDDINGDEIRELARIALASLDAEPVAWMCEDEGEREYNSHNEFSCGRFGVPLYAAPPAPVVPEEVPATLRDEIIDLCDGYEIGDVGAQEIWSACRLFMIQGESLPALV
ncbi:hypothetical protein IIG13_002444 [Salmonella enterica]|nr:hypothetical protein [Salmonella enterica]EDR1499695.1 hypothetical protein [Salmonella enterica subsp. enterica serovar Javiana]EAB2724982.1 hypothetical protein [Salmonella enterica]EBO7536677.1 hypothetical protein [Salmonella enterica]EDY5684549.1 hypothetical protein [Salmonella enterica]